MTETEAKDYMRGLEAMEEMGRSENSAPWLAECPAHGCRYPYQHDCPECVKDAKRRGMGIDDYYREVRPHLGRTVGGTLIPRWTILPSMGEGVDFTQDQQGEWVRWQDVEAAIRADRAHLRKLAEANNGWISCLDLGS